MEHSKDYKKFKNMYLRGYITKDQLKRWVAINAKNSRLGITEDEYSSIINNK